MPAPHPRMHGITHVVGGPDPVPGLLPPLGNALDSKILAAADAFWKLDESSGTVAHDSTGNGHDLDSTGWTAPAWGQPTGPPGTTSAGFAAATPQMRLGAPLGFPLADYTDDFTAGVWVNFSAFTSIGEIIGQGQAYHAQPGWAIVLLPVGVDYKLTVFVAGNHITANDPAAGGTWYFVAVVRDGGSWLLYIDGLLQAATFSASPGSGYGANTWLGNDAYSSHSTYLRDATLSYAFIAGRVMSGTELLELVSATELAGPVSILPGGPGSVLGLDENGEPAWVKPPAPAVTVNGSSEPAAKTPKPTPPAPPAPDTDPAGVLIIDQPFVYGGSTFTVQPRVWTTIPFTTPLMERMSDKTGVSAWAEIPVTDPDAGDWLSAADPHAITIPHDMPFMAEAMGQICLRIDNPIVEGATTHRALRIFETTHQKTLLQVDSEQADGAGAEGGMTDVFRGPGITVFASGDTGSTGSHPDIFFLPNYGLAFYPTGYDWLPYVAGVQSLRAGMRLVAQCWHDASVPLTFNAGGGTTYKPHFVLNVDADPAWGPPWSTWLP